MSHPSCHGRRFDPRVRECQACRKSDSCSEETLVVLRVEARKHVQSILDQAMDSVFGK